MATVKIRFRASTVENKEGTLVYQVIHKRQTSLYRLQTISTGMEHAVFDCGFSSEMYGRSS